MAAASPSSTAWGWRLGALGLIVSTAVLRVVYLAAACPLDLAPDEAHYWDWSRHLDWSYYSKGPLVAYLIRGGCEIFGPWSEAITGSQMLAVRLPAVVSGSLLLAALYVLTVQVWRSERLAFGVVACALTSPVVTAGSTLMTIDAPYTCCWAWACVLGYQAIVRGAGWAWPVLGLVVGLGTLAKYTMLLWVPSAALFLFSTPGFRRLLARPGFWVMGLVGAGCCLPILVWNVQHQWVSLRHVGGQAGIAGSAGIRWHGPVEFVGVQFALLLGFWFVAWAAAVVVHRPGAEAEPGKLYLWWLSVPTFAVFLAFSLKTPEEPNWPVVTYVSGLVLAVGWVARQLESPRTAWRRAGWAALGCACALGLGVSALMHRSDLFGPVLARLSGPPTERHPLPLRRFDPTCRLRGWRTLAAAVDGERSRLRERGEDPIVAASGWNLPGELGFYCQGRPQAYSLGLALGDRHSQYDLWRPNPVADLGMYRGRTFVYVGPVPPALQQAFDTVEPAREVVYSEGGRPLAAWTVSVCRGFRGFGPGQVAQGRY